MTNISSFKTVTIPKTVYSFCTDSILTISPTATSKPTAVKVTAEIFTTLPKAIFKLFESMLSIISSIFMDSFRYTYFYKNYLLYLYFYTFVNISLFVLFVPNYHTKLKYRSKVLPHPLVLYF